MASGRSISRASRSRWRRGRATVADRRTGRVLERRDCSSRPSVRAAPRPVTASRTRSSHSMPRRSQLKDWFSQPGAEFVTGPSVFQENGTELVAAATKDGRVVVLNATALGGAIMARRWPLRLSSSRRFDRRRRAGDMAGDDGCAGRASGSRRRGPCGGSAARRSRMDSDGSLPPPPTASWPRSCRSRRVADARTRLDGPESCRAGNTDCRERRGVRAVDRPPVQIRPDAARPPCCTPTKARPARSCGRAARP